MDFPWSQQKLFNLLVYQFHHHKLSSKPEVERIVFWGASEACYQSAKVEFIDCRILFTVGVRQIKFSSPIFISHAELRKISVCLYCLAQGKLITTQSKRFVTVTEFLQPEAVPDVSSVLVNCGPTIQRHRSVYWCFLCSSAGFSAKHNLAV